jgi:hypothetical protein
MNELHFQRDIVESVRDQGGYAQKIASRFQVGVPDLLIGYPSLGFRLVECKWLGNQLKPRVHKVELTSPQRHHLTRANRVIEDTVGVVFVGWRVNRDYYFSVVAPGQHIVDLGTAISFPKTKGKYDVRHALVFSL